METKAINLYLADDHAIVVDGLKEILKARPYINILGTASDGLEVQKLMEDRPADVVAGLSGVVHAFGEALGEKSRY